MPFHEIRISISLLKHIGAFITGGQVVEIIIQLTCQTLFMVPSVACKSLLFDTALERFSFLSVFHFCFRMTVTVFIWLFEARFSY